MIKVLRRIISLLYRVKDWFKPLPPIAYQYCFHCCKEYPQDMVTSGSKMPKFTEVETIFLDFMGHVAAEKKSLTFTLPTCIFCKDGYLNLYRVTLGNDGSIIQLIWTTKDGSTYECAEIPKDTVKKK